MSDPKSGQAGSDSKPAGMPPAKGPNPSGKVDLDLLLRTEVGEFGKFQIQSLIVAMILVVFTGVANVNYIFATKKINTRCLIPECESKPAVYSVPWVLNAIPPDKKEGHNLCYRYAPAAGAPAQAAPGTCPAAMFNRNKKEACKEYVHENRYSVAYDFELECKEWSRSTLGMIRKLGTLAALPVTSYISDRWGRRIALVVNSVFTAAIGMLKYWAPNYWSYTTLDFLEGTLGSGVFSCAYVLMVEVFGPKWRVAAGACINTAYSTGQITMGLCAWMCPYWRPLMLVLYVPQFSSILAYWTITESVRWYMSKGMFNKSEALLKEMAARNGRSVSDASLAALKQNVLDEKAKAIADAQQNVAGPNLVSQVLSHKRVLLRVIVSPVWWISTIFIYHGLALNATSIHGNAYQNYVLVSAIELPGFWIAYYFLPRVGRKPVLSVGFWVCGLCLFGYIFIPKSYQLPVYMVAKCSIALVLTSVYCYTAELYPTSNRHKLLALASMFGRIGSITAPLTPAMSSEFFPELPFVLFGSLSILSGILIFLTPETLGTVLPDTFEQAEKLGLKEAPRT